MGFSLLKINVNLKVYVKVKQSGFKFENEIVKRSDGGLILTVIPRRLILINESKRVSGF